MLSATPSGVVLPRNIACSCWFSVDWTSACRVGSGTPLFSAMSAANSSSSAGGVY